MFQNEKLSSLLKTGTLPWDKSVPARGETGPWNSMAKQNAIDAAIATKTEEGEARKTAYTTSVLLRELKDGIVLDLGCGYGRVAKYLLRERNFAGYIGLDASVEMLKIFQSKTLNTLTGRSTPVMLLHSNIDCIPLNDASVDNVIVTAVFLHNPKIVTRESLKEIRRVLKPGGKLITIGCFPSHLSGRAIQGNLYLAMLHLTGRGKNNGPVRYFWKNELKTLLSAFHRVSIQPFGFEALPKTILGLSASLNVRYHSYVWAPLQKFAERVAAAGIKKTFCVTYDVIAER